MAPVSEEALTAASGEAITAASEEALTAASRQREQIMSELADVRQEKQKVEALVALGVVDVSPQAEFTLGAAVSRGELATWLVKAANLSLQRVTEAVFTDVPANHPLAPFIKAAVSNNFMQAQKGYFYPDNPVSKAEAEEIFRRFGIIK